MSMFTFEANETLVLQDDGAVDGSTVHTEARSTQSAISEQPREIDPIAGIALTATAAVAVFYFAIKTPKKEDRYIH